jgi:hypothetical protein
MIKKKMENKTINILAGTVSILIIVILLVSFLVIYDGSPKVISKEVKEKLRKDETARVLVKTSSPVGITSFENLEKDYLFLDSNKNIEIKQMVGGHYSIEVDSKSLDEVLKKIPIDKVIMDDVFEIFIDESMEIVSVKEINNLGYTGKDVKICVIDTGVNWEVLGLQYGLNVFGYNSMKNSEEIKDENGHGTKMVSVLSSIAPDANFYIVKAIDDDGKGYASDVGAAIEWCVSKNVDLISMSIGTGNFEGICENDFVAGIVNDVVYDGIPVFAATGNDGGSLISSPACSGLATPVTSSSKLDEISIFSDYNENVFVVAPGEGILVINQLGQFVVGQGTSFSTSFVAGIAALHFEKSRVIDPLSLETKMIRSGKVLEFEGKRFSRIDSYNFLEDNLTNNLSRSNYDYEDWFLYKLEENEIKGEDSIFKNLQTCTAATDCTKQICVEGYCVDRCNSTYDGDRCSDDDNSYSGVGGGTCSRNNVGNYGCAKEEVALDTWHYFDCYNVEAGAPSSEYLCDRDVAPNFVSEGICSISTGSPSTSNVNCDIDEVCIDSSGYYRSSCIYCEYNSERSCDSQVDGEGYSQDGICAFNESNEWSCETESVCINSSGFFISSFQMESYCSDNDPCDSEIISGYVNDGLVCNSKSLGCVVNGSRKSSQSCCDDSNCEGESTCVEGICSSDVQCPPHPETFISSSDAVFVIKNSTGQVCFAINSSGDFVIAGGIFSLCSLSPPSEPAFVVSLGEGEGTLPLWINESCYICSKGPVRSEKKSELCSSNSFCIKNNTGSVLMLSNITKTVFYGSGCYDYNSGYPLGVPIG